MASIPNGSESEKCMKPMPRSPARIADSGCVPDIQIGGCGFWTGFGRTLRGGILKVGESQENSSCVHILGIMRRASSHCARVRLGSIPKPSSSSADADRPVPKSSRPLLMMSSVAAISAARMGLL